MSKHYSFFFNNTTNMKTDMKMTLDEFKLFFHLIKFPNVVD